MCHVCNNKNDVGALFKENEKDYALCGDCFQKMEEYLGKLVYLHVNSLHEKERLKKS